MIFAVTDTAAIMVHVICHFACVGTVKFLQLELLSQRVCGFKPNHYTWPNCLSRKCLSLVGVP